MKSHAKDPLISEEELQAIENDLRSVQEAKRSEDPKIVDGLLKIVRTTIRDGVLKGICLQRHIGVRRSHYETEGKYSIPASCSQQFRDTDCGSCDEPIKQALQKKITAEFGDCYRVWVYPGGYRSYGGMKGEKYGPGMILSYECPPFSKI